MIGVLFDRLVDMVGIDSDYIYKWPDSEPISLDDVLKWKGSGLSGCNKPYGDTWQYPVTKCHDMKYHIARIIYFMEHPEEIKRIEVDNLCFEMSILPGCTIVDGWHRIAAGMMLHLNKVWIEYGSRSDAEDYITGKTDERPEDILVF